MLDISLLQIVKYRQKYKSLHKSVPLNSLDPKTKAILEDFGKYFEKFPDHEVIDMQVFTPMFFRWHMSFTEDQRTAYGGLLKQISHDADEGTQQGILSQMYELDLAAKMLHVVTLFESGELPMPLGDVANRLIDAYKINVGHVEIPWDDTPIEDLLKEDQDNSGLQWRLRCLNESMRPLRGGDFGIIAGRPDKGKTSFLTSEVTFMAPQLPPEKNIIWLNNEGIGGRIRKRLYQSALMMKIGEIAAMANINPNDVRELYHAAVGRLDKIRVLDIHGWHVGQVEAVLEKSEPGVVVFDMIDNIKFFSMGEGRTDQKLEEMYAHFREKAVKYEFVGLATSQISAEGDNMMYPGLSMLKESKTGKQGACDFQLMIGAVDDRQYENSRFLGLPKNKLARDEGPKNPNCEVFFDSRRGIYKDVEVVPDPITI